MWVGRHERARRGIRKLARAQRARRAERLARLAEREHLAAVLECELAAHPPCPDRDTLPGHAGAAPLAA